MRKGEFIAIIESKLNRFSNGANSAMKKEIPMPAVVGVIIGLVVIIAAVLFWPGRKAATPEEAGLGKPAIPGGGTGADPSKGPAPANP